MKGRACHIAITLQMTDCFINIQPMMNNPYSIYYDMQKNSFYRVNKDNGEAVRAYLNGQNVPYFKPNVTGFEAHRRKSVIDANYFSRKESPKHSSSPSTISQRLKNLSKLDFSTINHDNISSLSNSRTNFHESLHSERNMYGHRFQPLSTKYLHQTLHQHGRNDVEDKFRSYQTIVEAKVKGNNSPRKDVDGSVQKKDILERLCITRNNFKVQQDETKLAKNKQKSRQKANKQYKDALQEYAIDKQIKKQRRFNLLVGKKDEYKSLERDKLRKQNLKRLEKDILRKNSNQEKEIFGSDRK